jgi:Raf kinase inhibitor-like YbhB/YbcL family protein
MIRLIILLALSVGCATYFSSDRFGISSSAFGDQEMIPEKFSCKGKNINPQLNISNIPDSTKSLVLIMDDPDAPKGTFDHWLVFNIPPVNNIAEDSRPGTEGKNGRGENKYTGPCPPSGTHHYRFKLYALKSFIDLPSGSSKKEIEKAMKDLIIDEAVITGLFKK